MDGRRQQRPDEIGSTRPSPFVFGDSVWKEVCPLQITKGSFGWRSGKVGGWKIVEGWKIFSFSSCVFGWRGGKMGG